MASAPLVRPRTPNRKPSTFEQQAEKVLRQLSAAMAALIEAIPAAGRIKRATDLQRTLGVHSKLAWQVFRIANADNVIEEGRAVPSDAAMDRLLEAAAKRGVPEAPIAAVRKAFEKFGEVVSTHAGNRAAFDSMVTGLTEDGSEPLDIMHKRAAFRAYSHFLGARARATLACNVFQPSERDPDSLDCLILKGLIDLSTQRRDTSVLLANIWAAEEDGSPHEHRGIEPLDAAGVVQGVALFRKFCSEPLPPLRTEKKPDGSLGVIVDGDLIDVKSALTLMLGFVIRSAGARYSSDASKTSGAASAIRTPSETLIHDVLVRDDVFPNASPRVDVFFDYGGSMVAHRGFSHAKPLTRENVIFLGRGLDILDMPEMPGYPKMVKAALAKVGWDPARFGVYRCRIEYPVVPSTVGIEFDLPEKPH
jgi:hypothetical protein